jgi:hypothetical protein
MMRIIRTSLGQSSTTIEIADGEAEESSASYIRIRVPRVANMGESVARAQSTALEAAQEVIDRFLLHNQRIA